MHRDEAIYARSDARGITLTAEELSRVLDWYHRAAYTLGTSDRDLAARLEAAS